MIKILLSMLLVLQASLLCAEGVRIDFNQGLKGWEEKVFNGRVDYQLQPSNEGMVLQAESHGKASALIYWIDINPQKYSKLRWRWKIERTLKTGHAGIKSADDYPARIYIVFDSWLPNYARSINYIWASQVERESIVVNPYYKRSIMLAVESGEAKAGDWVVEERDLIEDYQRSFGGEIPKIKAVAVMSDGDNTGESVKAWFDWIEFVSEEKGLAR